ncbi:hypothetical protein BGW80DRAFT_729524 [Lactifluus volemus]|nr:hypothetical protein BGW80DRAFT_729524 [Lactifluus volemus]
MDREVSIIPQRRTHQEIIDVDELDDEQDQRPSRRSRLAVPEDDTLTEIIILDNDEGSESGPSTRPRHSGKAILAFSVLSLLIWSSSRCPITLSSPAGTIHSPSPSSTTYTITSSSARPPHIFPQDIIRPNEEPFPFERSFSRPTSHPPRDVTPSRHHPVINLGGGFSR